MEAKRQHDERKISAGKGRESRKKGADSLGRDVNVLSAKRKGQD